MSGRTDSAAKPTCLYPLPDGRRCCECDACQASTSSRWWQRYPGDPLPYYVMRLLWIRQAIRDVPWRARFRWLWNALTYEYEICFDCGRKNCVHADTYWLADDDLWNEVIGHPSGILCTACFTQRASVAGIPIHWKPVRGV